MHTLILGIGTGRCGTKSLATLLNKQPGAQVTHERFGHKVRWGAPWRTYPLALYQKAAQDAEVSGVQLVGDVGFYWLPQVERFARRCEEDGVDLKVICMHRDREEVVASFQRKVGAGVDHWRYRPEEASEWSWCFPCYDAETREDAIGMYWEAYHEEVERLQEAGVPIRWQHVSTLNSTGDMHGLLSWCGVRDPVTDSVHVNRTAQ